MTAARMKTYDYLCRTCGWISSPRVLAVCHYCSKPFKAVG